MKKESKESLRIAQNEKIIDWTLFYLGHDRIIEYLINSCKKEIENIKLDIEFVQMTRECPDKRLDIVQLKKDLKREKAKMKKLLEYNKIK